MKKCSKFGLGIRLIVAAAPSPSVPAPPGKPPFPLSSSSSLCRRCFSWWFCKGNAHGRDSTTTNSSRATRRRWWQYNPEGSQQDYGFSSLEEDDYDYEDEAAFSGFGWARELFDESWFSKVSKTYGVLLPVMLTSMFAATGLKAFLMAMAIPLSQSAISFLLRRKGDRDDKPWMIFFKKNVRWRRPFQEEEYPKGTGGRGNGYSSSSSNNNYYEGRRRRQRHSYRSWVPKDFGDAASTTSHGFLKRSSSGDGGGNKSSGGYGGWDELVDTNTAAAHEAKKRRSSNSYPQLAKLIIAARDRGLQRLGRKMRIITAAGGGGRVEQGVGAPPERMRMRRRGMPRTMGRDSTSTRYKRAPTLMRLLVAVFPFLGSWFRLI